MTGEQPSSRPAATAGRRSTATAAGLLVAAAAALWASSRMTWVRAVSSDGLGADRVHDLNGSQWAAAVTPLALALLAAIAAAFAVRGIALRVVAVAVAAVAVGAAIPAAGLLIGVADAETAARVAGLPARATVTSIEVSTAPAILVLAGAVLAFAAAVVLWRVPREQAGLSSKYDAPAARRDAAARGTETGEPVTERTLWDALDAGEDPTIDFPDTGDDDETGDSGTRRQPS